MASIDRFAGLVLGLALAACGGGGGSSVADSSESGPSGSSGALCGPGWEGCPCAEGLCIAGLECLSGYCVALPSAEATSSGVPSSEAGTTMAAEESSSAATESTDPSASSSEGSSSGVPAECVEGDSWCPDPNDFQICIDGQWYFDGCDDWCEMLGYDSYGCADIDRCGCAGYLDEPCAQAADVYCLCRSVVLDLPCEDGLDPIYELCLHEEDPQVLCYGEYEISTIDDCQAPVMACE